MKGLLITLLILLILGMIKVGVRAQYQKKKFRLDVLICRFKLTVVGQEEKFSKIPKPQKEKKQENFSPKHAKESQKTSDGKKAASSKLKDKGKWKPWLDAVLVYWQEILSLIGKVLTSPTLDDIQIEVLVGGDAEKCAMTYGRICSIVGVVLPVVENTFGIRKRRIDIIPSFDRDGLEISADVSLTLRIYEIFALVFALLGLGLKIYLEVKNNKKGGAAV